MRELQSLNPRPDTATNAQILFLGGLLTVLATLSAAALAQVSSLAGNLVLFTIVTGFIVAGLIRRIPVYDCFIEGARSGER